MKRLYGMAIILCLVQGYFMVHGTVSRVAGNPLVALDQSDGALAV